MNYKINNHFAKIKENKLNYQFVFFQIVLYTIRRLKIWIEIIRMDFEELFSTQYEIIY